MNLSPVLYVEDEENDVFFMKRGFARAGLPHGLQIATNGEEAIHYLTGNAPFCDRLKYPLPCLVLLDLNIPIRSGFEVLQWLRQQPHFLTLPVVVFTASSHDSDKQKALQLGANEFITKPTDMSRLPALLEEIKARWLV